MGTLVKSQPTIGIIGNQQAMPAGLLNIPPTINLNSLYQKIGSGQSATNTFTNNGGGGSYVSNNLFSQTTALQAYNPNVNANFNNTGTRSQSFSTNKTLREIDINSFMWYFIISVFVILMLVFLGVSK